MRAGSGHHKYHGIRMVVGEAVHATEKSNGKLRVIRPQFKAKYLSPRASLAGYKKTHPYNQRAGKQGLMRAAELQGREG